MKLGLLTAAFGDRSLEDAAAWAAAHGYEMLEVACWPDAGAEKRRSARASRPVPPVSGMARPVTRRVCTDRPVRSTAPPACRGGTPRRRLALLRRAPETGTLLPVPHLPPFEKELQ